MSPRYSISIRQPDLERSQRWPVSFLRRVVRTTLSTLGCADDLEMSLTLTDDAHIRLLNSRYRCLDQATDVLAFALEEGDAFELPLGLPRQLGDVVVSLETTRRQAQESGNPLESELAWVITHGTLHLLGYDHQTHEQLMEMREQERKVLDFLKISRHWPELWPAEERMIH